MQAGLKSFNLQCRMPVCHLGVSAVAPEEVESVVFVATDFVAQPVFQNTRIGLLQCIQAEKTAGASVRPMAALWSVSNSYDQSGLTDTQPCPAGDRIPSAPDSRRVAEEPRRFTGTAVGFIPISSDDERVVVLRSQEGNDEAHG